MSVASLEAQLNDFSLDNRICALREIARKVDSGEVRVQHVKPEVNLHYHTFFSYNANGWSPSRIAWEARKYGLEVSGIVDFDVLDGMEEFLQAGEIIGVKTTAAMESRVFVNEYAQHVISSPHEPGIAYFMAAGCFKTPDPGTNADSILRQMREMARRRNLQVMDGVNAFLDSVTLDYDTDVLPLTPSGNATERHMLAAYDTRSRAIFGDESEALAEFWSEKLDFCSCEITALLDNTPKFHEVMRSKLMKYGGVGYVAPTSETFPTVESVIEMTQGMDALPMATWLDGTNSGEANMPAMLGLLASKGVVAMNIIPDRNWNIKDPDEKRVKVVNLAKAIRAARDFDFPICVGTEMNKGGLPFVDDFQSPDLTPYVAEFIDGANFLWGHTFLARNAGIGFASDWAKANFGPDRKARNAFYTKVGSAASPESFSRIASIDLKSASPDQVIAAIEG